MKGSSKRALQTRKSKRKVSLLRLGLYVKTYLETFQSTGEIPKPLHRADRTPTAQPPPEWVVNRPDEGALEVDEYSGPEIEFSQLIPLMGCPGITVGVEWVEMAPDETAMIRVMSDDTVSRRYKRKVNRDRNNNRYIRFSGQRLYLDDKKTKPFISEEVATDERNEYH